MSQRRSGKPPERRVLVVDDHVDARRMLAAFLRAHDFRVALAADGLAALGKLQLRAYDLVILDLRMPKLDGFGFLRRLSELPGARAEVPVVVISGAPPQAVEGAAACFQKPVPLAELLAAVQRFVAS